MKIIPKLITGGNFFTQYKNISTDTSEDVEERLKKALKASQGDRRYSSTKEEAEEKGKLTEKDLFSMLKDIDGLPNDIQVIMTDLMNTFQMSKLMHNDIEDLSITYLSVLDRIKNAQANKKAYDEALKNARENGAMYEPAILGNQIMVQTDDGQIHSIELETYLNDKDKYHPLTVSNIAYLRANDPDFRYNTKSFEIMNNSVGFNSFQKIIDSAKLSLGSSMDNRTGYFSAEGEASKGLQLLQTLSKDDQVKALGSVTAEGLYEYKIIDKNQLNQIKTLTSYLAHLLPQNIKTWAGWKMQNADTTKATKELIETYLLSGSTNEHTFDINYKGSMEKVTKGSSSSSDRESNSNDNGKLKLNTASKWLAGFGNKENFVINLGDNNSFIVSANTMPLVDMNSNYLGVNSTLQQVSQGQYASILDLRNASMGMKLIDPNNFGQIILSDGKISSVDFPYIEENGIIMPDLSKETKDKKEEAERKLKAKGISLLDPQSIKNNYSVINQIYESVGLPAAYNSDGSLKIDKWRRFGVINGKASNKALGMGQFDENFLLQEDNDDNSIQNYTQIIKDENWDYNNWYDINGHDHLYKGTIWIPIQVDYHAALANENMYVDDALKLEEKNYALYTNNQLTLGRQLQN